MVNNSCRRTLTTATTATATASTSKNNSTELDTSGNKNQLLNKSKYI